MSNAVYSEINLHMTWHTKSNLPMITPMIEEPLHRYLTHKIIETPGAYFHGIGGTETHIHIAASAYYINHEVKPKALEWQRGYGIVTFGTRDLKWVVDYINNQKVHHRKGTIHDRLERSAESANAAADVKKGR
jgi:putative transposase